MKYIFMLPLVLWAFSACTPTAQPIEYGSDACHFCKMTIVDRQHAAEAVSAKGKVFKFDAIECLIPFLAKQGEDHFPIIVINDFMSPATWTDARNAIYLICPELPSPMGASLSGFNSVEAAQKIQQEKGGNIYTWETVKQQINR
jgi:copper chaperone NosL